MDRLAKEILYAAVTQNTDIPDALPTSTAGLIQVDYKRFQLHRRQRQPYSFLWVETGY